MGGHFGKNVVIAVSLMAAGFLAAWLRFSAHLDTEGAFTDGEQTIEIDEVQALRYAVWDSPEALGGEVNTDEDEHAPAVSPDGRYLVFVVGERGLGTDLWIADLDARGVAHDPRPLPGVNSAADDLAPAFGNDGALLFASNRPGGAGGLDLWRAPYDNGVFDAAEHLGSELNTAADETDPSAVPGSGELLFSSNRRTEEDDEETPRGRRRKRLSDYDIYKAEPLLRTADGRQPWEVVAIEAINTPFDERDPAATSDGRALLFASDRVRGDESITEGDFDLYRASRAPRDRSTEENPADWLEPRPLVGVNQRGTSERHPRSTADGFALLFSRGVSTLETVGEADGLDVRGDGEAWDVWRATSRELVRTPGRPVGWREILVLVGLLLLALLAALAKRWRGLDIIYKAFLISLLIHLALLFFSKDVAPSSDPVELGGGEASRVRVRLMEDPNSLRAQRNQERGGALEAIRTQVEAAADPAASEAPSAEERNTESAPMAMSSLERSSSEAAPAPERLAVEAPDRAEPTREVDADVAQVEESFEKLAGAAPSMAVDARSTDSQRVETETAEAARSTEAVADTSTVTPEAAASATVELARSEPAEPLSASPERRDVAVDRSGEAPTLVADATIAAPSESFSRMTGDARSADRPLDVAQSSAANLEARAKTGKAVAPNAAPQEGATQVTTELAPSAGPSLARAAQQSELAAVEPTRQSAEVSRSEAQPSSVAVQVAAPSAEAQVAPLFTAAAPSFNALSGAGQAATEIDRTVAQSGAPNVVAATEVNSAPAAISTDLAPSAASELVRSRPGGGPSGPSLAQLGPRRIDTQRNVESTSSRDIEIAAPKAIEATPRVDVAAVEGPKGLDLAPMDTGQPLRRSDSDRPTQAPGLLAAAGPEVERSLFETPVPLSREIQAPAAPAPIVAAPVPTAKPELWDKTPYQSRSGKRKIAALEEFGGSEETERAVERGLAYLAKKQRSDGRWGGKVPDEKYGTPMIGKTGLAVLAFMGAGHTTTSRSIYSQNVIDGIEFLKAHQGARSGHFGDTSSYGHAIATYALGEAFALTGDEGLRRPLERAVQHIINSQHSSKDPLLDGGWSYYFGDDRKIDKWPRASITAWQVMALESAKLGGIDVPRQVFNRAQTFLVNTWDPGRGAFRYSHDPSRLRSNYPLLPGSTPATMFALSLLGADISEDQFRPSRNFVLTRSPNGYRFTGDDDFVFKAQGNLYFWYYGTLAMFRAGGQSWQRWNVAMKSTLLPAQDSDGSWRPISIYAKYAQDRDNDRIYTTAMNVLALEVYYRYFTPLLKVD